MTNKPVKEKDLIFDGKDEVRVYAFLAIRRALKWRVEHGTSLMRGREIEAARNHGWTNARTSKRALADLNAIARKAGLEEI